MNKQAIKEAIYRELYRQGIEFASVIITPYAQHNSFGIGVKQLRDDQGDPKHYRVENRVTPPPPPNFSMPSELEMAMHWNIPDGLENLRELDQEIGELIDLGLIEHRDCGYALVK